MALRAQLNAFLGIRERTPTPRENWLILFFRGLFSLVAIQLVLGGAAILMEAARPLWTGPLGEVETWARSVLSAAFGVGAAAAGVDLWIRSRWHVDGAADRWRRVTIWSMVVVVTVVALLSHRGSRRATASR